MARAIDAGAYVEDLRDLYEKLKNISDKCESIRDKEIALLQMSLLSECVVILTEQPTIEPKQEWISVKDRLPEEEDSTRGMVLAVENDKERMVKLWGWDIVVKYPNEFTHWMPLPQPPKEGGEE